MHIGRALLFLSFFLLPVSIKAEVLAKNVKDKSLEPIWFNFETGDLQGWRVVWGKFGELPSENDNDRWGGNFNKEGKWFIGTCELGEAKFDDGMTGEIRSPAFVVHYNKISLLVGGGNHPGRTYVALCRASDDKELIVETGRNREAMDRRYWDVSKYKGIEVYIKVVDAEKGGWGHINVDDIRELTPKEEEELMKKEAERKRETEKKYGEWLKTVMAKGPRRVYKGKSLTHLAMPLGGIGAGSIALCGDASLREWQIFNHVNKQAVVPHSFFAIWARASRGSPVCKLLQTRRVENLPTIEAVEYVGEYPIAYLKYKDSELPVEVSLEAFSPLIPLNAKDSALPGIVFIFRVKNLKKEKVEVSVAASLQNAVGYDGFSEISGVENKDYGGNSNRVIKKGNLTAVQMSAAELPKHSPTFGTMTLATRSNEVSYVSQWDEVKKFWPDFSKDGALSNVNISSPSEKGRTWNGALCVPLTLRPSEERRVVFFICWHFPNRYRDWISGEVAQYRLGNMYNNWFHDSLSVAEYLNENFERLYGETKLFHDTLYDSTLPYYLLDCISSQISTIRSQTCMWLEDGTFAGFEGCGGNMGCCPMNCTHVWNYEQTLAHLFPSLERNMRETDLKVQQDKSGFIHHRTVLPLSLPRGHGPFPDGHLGTILKTYREYLRSADRQWLDSIWPNVRLAMEYAIKNWDVDDNGVIEGEQWNTYDCAVYGPNTFIGTLYLGALRAAEEMAKVEGEPELARRYRKLYEKGRKNLDSQLWNGEYYIQKYDAEKYKETQYGTGCLSDQLLGQWWAHLLNLGYLLPEERVKKALKSIVKYNWRLDFVGFVQQPRVFASDEDKGLLCCTWPKGGRPDKPIFYCDEVWTGVEYQVGAHLIYEGFIEDGLKIVKGARDRYAGTNRNPWNEIECGDHYVRPMSSWSLLLTSSGYIYEGPKGLLGFVPRLTPDNFKAFFTVAEGWGSFSQRRTQTTQSQTIELKYGSLNLKELVFRPLETAIKGLKNLEVRLDSKKISVTWEVDDKTISITLRDQIKLRAGEKIQVRMSW